MEPLGKDRAFFFIYSKIGEWIAAVLKDQARHLPTFHLKM